MSRQEALLASSALAAEVVEHADETQSKEDESEESNH
jgi:hypothetical protein